eukprot:scaffold2240_cov124-Isochrysis_galbana.AAC.1
MADGCACRRVSALPLLSRVQQYTAHKQHIRHVRRGVRSGPPHTQRSGDTKRKPLYTYTL